jgi:hypothetical protein
MPRLVSCLLPSIDYHYRLPLVAASTACYLLREKTKSTVLWHSIMAFEAYMPPAQTC